MKRVRNNFSQRWPHLVKKKVLLPVAPRPDHSDLVLGSDSRRQPVILPIKSLLEHALILGATGSGKSRAQFQIARQAIVKGHGLAWVDPHGTDDYRDLAVWLSKTEKRVHVIDFRSPNVVAFNPLACPEGTDPSVIVGNMMDAMAAGWDDESLAQKPTVERVMSAMFAALVELKLTICEAPLILDRENDTLRRYAIENVRDDFTRSVLKSVQALSQDVRRKRDYDQEVMGPVNRLARLLRPPTIRAMLGQTKNCIDFKSVMDNGEIVLANLSGGTQVYEKDADLFGKLLTRSILFHAKRRDNTQPFLAMLDEAHRYLSNDLPVLLAEIRKYGVSIVAAMQWLAQAERTDDTILAALLNGTNCKICFRLRDQEEAERMARTLIQLNLERPVDILTKPTVVGHRRTLLANESDSTQQSVTKNRSLALGTNETDGVTHTQGTIHTHSVTDGTTDVESEMQSKSKSKGSVSGEGTSAAEIMIPTDDPSEPIISRTTAGLSNSNSSSSASATGSAKGRAKGKTHAVTDGIAESESVAVSKSFGTSRVETEGEGETQGTGHSKGHSEALEPIMEDRPSSVHALADELYTAGKMLCGMPRGLGYLSYVGNKGPVGTLFQVPFIEMPQVNTEQFIAIRDRYMTGTPTLPEALQVIADRAESLTTPPQTPKKTPQAPKPAPKNADNPQEDHSEPDFY